jgi:glyoxylase-like metal-dependent hydrolase (beta-lactamase superfamily II)
MSNGLPRWTPMNSAHYLVDRSLMVANRDPGISVRITTTWSVLEHPAGVVVIDTGVAPETAATSWQARDRSPDQPVMAPGGTVTARLAALGIRRSDVRYVVNTHLHLDHTGGNRELAGAAFLTRAAELAYAREPDVPSLALEYSTDQIAESRLRYVCVEGDHDVFGDGCLTLVPSPGHSAGHQSALLRLPDTGNVLITGDAIWTRDCIDDLTLPGVLSSPSAYVASRRRLLGLARDHDARLFFSHEPSTFEDEGWQEGLPLR